MIDGERLMQAVRPKGQDQVGEPGHALKPVVPFYSSRRPGSAEQQRSARP
jgi:hypothetical protein